MIFLKEKNVWLQYLYSVCSHLHGVGIVLHLHRRCVKRHCRRLA